MREYLVCCEIAAGPFSTGYRREIGEDASKFGDLAKKYSDCSSAHKSGDLGEFGRGQMQKAFEDVAFGINVGEISQPFLSDSGVHIVLRTA